jgi:hypothetical protein
MYVDGCNGLPTPQATNLSFPYNVAMLPELPGDCTNTLNSGSSGTWEQAFIGQIYEEVQARNQIDSKFSSNAPYSWTWTHNSMDGNDKVYRASGVNIVAAAGAVLLIDFIQTKDWTIVANP